MAKVARFHKFGGPEVMQIDDLEVGDPGPGEVRLRHTAIGVNYIDTYHRSGLYKLALPSGIGLEAAGVDSNPSRPTSTRPKPLAAAMRIARTGSERLLPNSVRIC